MQQIPKSEIDTLGKFSILHYLLSKEVKQMEMVAFYEINKGRTRLSDKNLDHFCSHAELNYTPITIFVISFIHICGAGLPQSFLSH